MRDEPFRFEPNDCPLGRGGGSAAFGQGQPQGDFDGAGKKVFGLCKRSGLQAAGLVGGLFAGQGQRSRRS